VVGHQRRIRLVDIAPPGETEVREDGGGGQAGGGAARTSQPGGSLQTNWIAIQIFETFPLTICFARIPL
jgi:hypothetical protein